MWIERSPAGRRMAEARRIAAGLLAVASLASVSAAVLADEERSGLERMLEAADQGDWGWAGHLAEGTGIAVLPSYVRWRELAESDDQPPFAEYADFLRGSPDWPGLGTIQTRAEEAMDDSVPPEDRLAFFAERQPRTRQGRTLLADALIDAGGKSEAEALLRSTWVGDDFGADEERSFLDRFGSYLDASTHAARLDRLLWDGRTDQARRMLPRVGDKEQAAGAARLKLQQSAGDANAALAALPASARRDPGVMFDRLRWRRKNGSDDDVQQILLDPPADLERPELWWREQDRAIRAALAERSFKLAYRLASASHQTSGIPFTEAEWEAGWLALQFTGQPKAARQHFERLWAAVSTPISKGRAGYWSGRAAAAVGAADAATIWYDRASAYPSSFYGQLAAAEIGRDPGAQVPRAQAATPAARDALRRRLPAQLGALFCRQGKPRYAQPFFRHMGYEAADKPEELAAVLELAQGCDRADLILAAARGAAGNGTNLVRESYPVPSVAAFQADRDGMPEPALVLAVARQESLFDPGARSAAGAMGLMQLMPGTAQTVSRALGENYTRGRLVRDPNYNIRVGAYYLGEQLTRFDNEPVLALAAYNAGPGRVTDWIELNGDPRGGDPYRLVDWIELIPFMETRNYVQRVLEGRGMYRIALGQPALPPARAVERDLPAPRTKPAS